MPESLRPMNLGEILDRTFQIYRSRFFTILAIRLASPLTTLALLILDQAGQSTILPYATRELFRQAAASIPADWVPSFVHYLGWPLISYLTSRELMAQRATLRSAIVKGKERWKSWLSISAFLWMVCTLFPYAFERLMSTSAIDPRVAFRLGTGPLLAAVSILFDLSKWGVKGLFVLGVALSPTAWAVEELGTIPSVRRAWALAKGSWMRILIVEFLRDFLILVLAVSLALIFGLAFSLALGGYDDRAAMFQIGFRAIRITEPAASALVGAIFPIALTLFYYDQRIRKEGYDIEQMMESAGMNEVQILPMESK